MFKKGNISSILRVLFLTLILMTMFSGFAFSQTVILNQAPTPISYFLSDPGQPETIAENFILSSTSTITQIRIWGCYVSTSSPGTDNFSVIFHADSFGLPGTVISAQNNVPVNRQPSGGPNIVGTLTEYLFTLTLATPVTLDPGTYWVEIYNDVTGSTDIFGWEVGTVDPVNGIAGLARDNTNVPGTSWSNLTVDTAIEIRSASINAVPSMTEWGMIIFIAVAGLGSVYYLRRHKRANN